MKAFIVDRYGSADRVRSSEVPGPEMREDDVLIEIHAAGVNPLDSKIRDGEFKLLLPYRLPLILGNELAGVVIRVGSLVRRFKPGDEVYARPDKNRIGTFAEFIAVSEDDLAIKPKSLTMEEAASIPLVGLTAWQALIEKAKLKKGQKVLIHAGSGGVGTFAIQLAKHVGETVATTTSTANVDLVKRLGADDVIPGIGSVMIWSPILPGRDRIHEEALYGRADHWLSAGRGDRDRGEGPVPEARVFRGELLPVEVQVWRDVGVGRQAAA